MNDKRWADTRTEMDIALSTGIQDNNSESVEGIVTDFDVVEIKPNKANIIFEISIQRDGCKYIASKETSYGDHNVLTDILDAGNPVGETVEVQKEDTDWTLESIKLSEKRRDMHIPSDKAPLMETYRDCIKNETTDKLAHGTLDDFYVIKSHSYIEQDYAIGLFINCPDGENRTLEVIHDEKCPSEVPKKILDLDSSLSSQLGSDIPMYYKYIDDKWYIYTGRVTSSSYISDFISKIFGKSVASDVSPDNLFQFGRTYRTPYPEPLPQKPSDIPDDRIPNPF